MRTPLAIHGTAPPVPGPDDLTSLTERERDVYYAVRFVMARWVYDGTCLRRALTLGWFLRRRRPVLRLGMIEGDATLAHAWIEVDGLVFNAQPVTSAFAGDLTEKDLTEAVGRDGRELP